MEIHRAAWWGTGCLWKAKGRKLAVWGVGVERRRPGFLLSFPDSGTGSRKKDFLCSGDEEVKEIRDKLPTLGIAQSIRKCIHLLLLPKWNHKLHNLKQ